MSMDRIILLGDADDHLIVSRMLAFDRQTIVIGCDVALDRVEYLIDGWAELNPSLPRFRRLPPVVPGRTIEHLRVAEPLGRRAARRARGRARAARRAALACPGARDGSPLGPSGPLLRRG